MRCRTILGLRLLCCCRCKDLRAEAAGGQRRKDSPRCEHAEAAAAPARRVSSMLIDRSPLIKTSHCTAVHWCTASASHATEGRLRQSSQQLSKLTFCSYCTRPWSRLPPAAQQSSRPAVVCRDACTRCPVKVAGCERICNMCKSAGMWLPTPPLILTVSVKLQHMCAYRILIGRMGFCVLPICLSMSHQAPPPVSICGGFWLVDKFLRVPIPTSEQQAK